MATVCRLVSGQLRNRIGLHNHLGYLTLARPVTIKASVIQPEKDEGYIKNNERIGRPQSPHLTIYRPQLTAMLSITHRLTGIAVTGYAVILGCGALVLPDTIPHYLDALQTAVSTYGIGSGTIIAAKSTIAFPLVYHFTNGVRHLFWDVGKFLTIKEVYTTGYATVVLSTIMSVMLGCM